MIQFFAVFSLLVLACAPLSPAAGSARRAFPFQNETLRYSVNWPSGLSLGEATMTARKTGDGGWNFDMSLDAGVPGFADHRQLQLVGRRRGSLLHELERDISHGSEEGHARRPTFDQKNSARRTGATVLPAGRRQERFRHSDLRARRADVPIFRAARNGAGTSAAGAEGILRLGATTCSMEYTGAHEYHGGRQAGGHRSRDRHR